MSSNRCTSFCCFEIQAFMRRAKSEIGFMKGVANCYMEHIEGRIMKNALHDFEEEASGLKPEDIVTETYQSKREKQNRFWLSEFVIDLPKPCIISTKPCITCQNKTLPCFDKISTKLRQKSCQNLATFRQNLAFPAKTLHCFDKINPCISCQNLALFRQTSTKLLPKPCIVSTNSCQNLALFRQKLAFPAKTLHHFAKTLHFLPKPCIVSTKLRQNPAKTLHGFDKLLPKPWIISTKPCISCQNLASLAKTLHCFDKLRQNSCQNLALLRQISTKSCNFCRNLALLRQSANKNLR